MFPFLPFPFLFPLFFIISSLLLIYFIVIFKNEGGPFGFALSSNFFLTFFIISRYYFTKSAKLGDKTGTTQNNTCHCPLPAWAVVLRDICKAVVCDLRSEFTNCKLQISILNRD
jgi:hypothetical protein